MNNKSASRKSELGYKFFKKVPDSIEDILIKFTHVCYLSSKVPTAWKLMCLYPILKPTDWNFSLAQTRPIILIDCMRKITTKIIGNRLENICRTRNILKRPNHAGLKGNSTDTPIHILNGIMEEAKDTNKEL